MGETKREDNETYLIAPNVRGPKMFKMCIFFHFAEKFFADAVNVPPSGLLYEYFCQLNFHG